MSPSAVKLDPDAVDVEVTDTVLRLTLADGRELSAPREWFPRLRDATLAQRWNWRLVGGGQGVRWPDVDEDRAVSTLLRSSRAEVWC
jgi:hypothetical protein